MKTILCIDDDPWVLDTLRQTLLPRGYRVLVTTSATAGPGLLNHEKIDLVLLDLNMPKKHGLDVYRELEATAAVPVLFVTACARSFLDGAEKFRKQYEKELRAARTELLAKPFTLTQLYEKVESLIGPASPSEHPEESSDEPVPWFKRLLQLRLKRD
ncbi:MAG TPA: response regulator [Verrucomicrobiae bacterium]|nr:response regulator [Verrucomicrobiae bacterium]